MKLIRSGSATARLAFGCYSFVENLIMMFMEFIPHPVRFLVFKIILAQLGPDSMIDYKTYFRYPWRIKIGRGVSINRGCEFIGAMTAENGNIMIGDYVTFAPYVRVITGTHDYSFLDLPDKAASVTIEDHVWICTGAIILPGVTIGTGAIIGAGSIVTKDVAPFTICAGNPARLIKKRELKE